MEDLRIGPTLTIPGDELKLSFARSSGPGGQKVNKASTKVEVRWNPGDSRAVRESDRGWLLRKLRDQLTTDGELIITSERTRTQSQNRADALDKLAETVRQALVRPKRRRPTKPTRGSVERRLKEKKHRGKIKEGRKAPDG
ncbi:MAG: alternative ribosome rescue aminoacyl-tRNA hydrolase ArfB [Myxococcales bacterium]